MAKKLITVGNFSEYVQNNKLVIAADMIITPGARDKIREQGVEVIYEKSCCEAKSKGRKDSQDFEKKIVEILVKEYNITDPATVQKILSRLKELS
jgi:hypothetical protein